MGKFKGESLLGRPKGRWEDYIRTDLKGIRCENVKWNDVALSRDKWRALVGGRHFWFHKSGEILDYLRKFCLFKQRSAP
jgi:hypothetical protein